MVQNPSPRSGARRSGQGGRPPAFDPDTVLDAAIAAFWIKGFEATSLAELEAATGLDRSSLYNSFGGKSGLYEQATERYLDRARDGLFNPLFAGSGDGLADIRDVLERLRTGLTAPDALPGCLVVNDMAAGPNPVPARRYLEMVGDGFRTALRRAAFGRAGSDETASVERHADLLTAGIVGINLVHRTTGDRETADRLVDSLIAEVSSWASEE